MSDRVKAMAALKKYYKENLAEDPENGSEFDMEVFHALTQAPIGRMRPPRVEMLLPWNTTNIQWDQQRLAADKINTYRGDFLVKPHPCLIIHAMVWAKLVAMKNHVWDDKKEPEKYIPRPIIDPTGVSFATRMYSYGFRGTHVGEYVTRSKSLERVLEHSVHNRQLHNLLIDKAWVYCGVGAYTINKVTYWCINLGGTDDY